LTAGELQLLTKICVAKQRRDTNVVQEASYLQKTNHQGRGEVMRKFLTALVAAISLASAAVAVPGTAEAAWGGWHGGGWGWHGGWGRGWGWGGAAVAGIAAGALVGAAVAAPYYYPPPAYYGYAPYPYYGYGYGCAWRTVWNGYAWVRACI
jgi:hypothetical protein